MTTRYAEKWEILLYCKLVVDNRRRGWSYIRGSDTEGRGGALGISGSMIQKITIESGFSPLAAVLKGVPTTQRGVLPVALCERPSPPFTFLDAIAKGLDIF